MKNGKSIAWLIWKEGLKLSSKLLKKRILFFWDLSGRGWYHWKKMKSALFVILRMKNENHWFADLFWPDGLKIESDQFEQKVWYLNEEWKLLVCRFGSDQLCLNRHWHCLQTETVSLAGLQNCSDQLCILHLKFEGWDCFVVECLYQHEWFEDFEHQSRSRVQKAKRRWGNVGTEQGRDGAEHRQARVGEELQSLVDYSTS